jgi:uncharacterized membrane protein YdjX (TVP38/TMEM64 family)
LIVAAVYSYLYIEDFSSSVHNAHDILVSGDEKRIESWTKHFGIWGPIVLLVGFIIQMILFILPSWLLIIVCILAYGPVFGVMISITGVFISASLAFMIGRTLNEHTLKKIIGEKTERKMSFYLERYGYKLLILLRLSP